MDARGDCPDNDCFDIVKTKKTYNVPCTKNVREAYTVTVPKTKAFAVKKQVPYIDYVPRTKQVPYQYMENRPVVRNVPTCRTFPVRKYAPVNMGCRRRVVRPFGARRKCPRTVYMKRPACQRRQFYQSIPRTGWRTVQENVPVQKFRIETGVQYTTEQVPEVRYRSRPVTTMIKKTVPVYSIVPKPPAPPGKEKLIETIPAPEAKTALPAVKTNMGAVPTTLMRGNMVDANKDGQIYQEQYSLPRQGGNQQHIQHAASGLPINYAGYDQNIGSLANGFQPVTEEEDRRLRQAENRSVQNYTSQLGVNYNTKYPPHQGNQTQVNTERMYGNIQKVPLEQEKGRFEKKTQFNVQATTSNNFAPRGAVPVEASQVAKDGGVSMAKSSVPNTDRMFRQQETSSNAKNDVGVSNNKYGNEYGTKNPKGYDTSNYRYNPAG